jgi:general L-amino acid transport system substrate-binding protein
MRRLVFALLCPLALPLVAFAGPRLDRIRAEGVVHCGAAIRPGLAFPAQDGTWHGLEVDVCHAAAVAALGPQAKTEFHAYTLQDSSYDPVRHGEDDLSFLTASEMLAAQLLQAILPGPPVYYSSSGILVLDGSPARHVADLAGKRICAEPGTGPERSLTAWFAAHHLPLHFFMFQESDEMLDAFYAGRCEAVAHDMVNLAAIRLQASEDGHEARLLPEPLAAVPVMAATPRGDDDWSAAVAWTVETLIRAETLGTDGPGGGPEPLPLAGKALGLAPTWQADVVKAVGSYAEIYKRNLGDASPLDLPRGLNALWTDGGLMCPPFSE